MAFCFLVVAGVIVLLVGIPWLGWRIDPGSPQTGCAGSGGLSGVMFALYWWHYFRPSPTSEAVALALFALAIWLGSAVGIAGALPLSVLRQEGPRTGIALGAVIGLTIGVVIGGGIYPYAMLQNDPLWMASESQGTELLPTDSFFTWRKYGHPGLKVGVVLGPLAGSVLGLALVRFLERRRQRGQRRSTSGPSRKSRAPTVLIQESPSGISATVGPWGRSPSARKGRGGTIPDVRSESVRPPRH